MSSTGELACTYAALILREEGLSISAENIATLMKASKVSAESYWPALFSRLFKGKSVDDLIFSVGSGGGGCLASPPMAAAAGAATVGGDAAPAEDRKNVEKAEESEDEDLNMFSLFD